MKKWGKPAEVVAQRIPASQIPGLLHKDISLEQNEVALVIRNGSVADELGAGKHSIKDFSEIILIDTAEKTIRKTTENLPAAGDREIPFELELVFDVYLPEKLARSLLIDKTLLTLDEIYSELYEQAISKILGSSLKNESQNIEAVLKEEIKKTLQEWGIELLNFSIELEFPEEAEVEKRGKPKTVQKKTKSGKQEQMEGKE